MEIKDICERISNDINESKAYRKNGHIAYAIRLSAIEINELLRGEKYRVPDLFDFLTKEMGGEPCDVRSFRRLCIKYCTYASIKSESTTPESTTPENTTPESTTPESTTPESTTPENTTPENTTPENTTPESTTPENSAPENRSPRKAKNDDTEYQPKYKGMEEETDKALIALGEKWKEIIESLGPFKKPQILDAINKGMTIEKAEEAREKSTKELQDTVTTFAMRRTF